MAGCCTYSNEPPTTTEDEGFLDKFIFFKDSFTFRWLSIAAVFIVFIFHFLFLCFYFVFFNSLNCVLFLTEPHARIYLILCLKRNKCCYWFHSVLMLVEVSV